MREVGGLQGSSKYRDGMILGGDIVERLGPAVRTISALAAVLSTAFPTISRPMAAACYPAPVQTVLTSSIARLRPLDAL